MIEPLSKNAFMAKMKEAEEAGDFSSKAVNSFWDWMYGEKNSTVQVCVFPVPTEDGDKAKEVEGKWLHTTSLEEFRDFCKTHSGLWRYHVYAGVNQLEKKPEYGRGRIEHIDTVTRLSFDIETEKESYSGATKEEVWWAYRYAIAQVKYISEEYGVLPMVVMSENGIHLHYRVNFKNHEDLWDGKQHIYSKYITHEAMNNPYCKQVKDKCPEHISIEQDDVSDPPRVMKVPGTRGIKSESGRLCGIIHLPSHYEAKKIDGSELDVTFEDLDEVVTEPTSESSDDMKVDTTPDDLKSDTIDKVKRIARTDRKFAMFWKGGTNGYKSRSEAEFAFILKMLSHDFSTSEIVDVMWASGMSKWDEETENYRTRTIENAVDYFDGTVIKDSKSGTFSFS